MTDQPGYDDKQDLERLVDNKLMRIAELQSENAKLWKFVKRQRDTILELRRDLDAAVDQNERLRGLVERVQSPASSLFRRPLRDESNLSADLDSASSYNSDFPEANWSSENLADASKFPGAATSGTVSPTYAADPTDVSQTTVGLAAVSLEPQPEGHFPVQQPLIGLGTTLPDLPEPPSMLPPPPRSDSLPGATAPPTIPLPARSSSRPEIGSLSNGSTQNAPDASPYTSNALEAPADYGLVPRENPYAQTREPDDRRDDSRDDRREDYREAPRETPRETPLETPRETQDPPREAPEHTVMAEKSFNASSDSLSKVPYNQTPPRQVSTQSPAATPMVVAPSTYKPRPPPLLFSQPASQASGNKLSPLSRPPLTPSSATPRDYDDLPYSATTPSEEYIPQDELLCVNPQQLATINVVVCSALLGKVGTALKVNGKDDPLAIFAAIDRITGQELWRFVKDYAQLSSLLAALKSLISESALPRLPDRSLFASSSPTKVDQRRSQLNYFFGTLMEDPQSLPVDAAIILSNFLASNVVQMPFIIGEHSGFLSKRGRLKSWKTRWYVLNGSYLYYFDRPDGDMLGSILIHRARIGRPKPKSNGAGDSDNEYDHALLIMEPKKNSHVSHVFCAESDETRDVWINALLKSAQLDTEAAPRKESQAKSTTSDSTASPKAGQSTEDLSHISSVTILSPGEGTPMGLAGSNSANSSLAGHTLTSSNSGPSIGKVPPYGFHKMERRNYSPSRLDDESDDNHRRRDASRDPPIRDAKAKKPGFFRFQKKSQANSDLDSPVYAAFDDNDLADDSDSRFYNMSVLFGVPLLQALSHSSKVAEDGCIVPSILFRCIELLEHKGAVYEEGLFRLSGSESTIRELKERFDVEYDIDLVALDADVHAVSGLMKRFLREMPEPVVPTSMDSGFREAMDIASPAARAAHISTLIGRLPRANRDLLYVLCHFLLKITNNSSLNKMTLKNLAIVFSPTLHIPGSTFTILLTDFDTAFAV